MTETVLFSIGLGVLGVPHWATGRVGTIVSIKERYGRPRYTISCTIEMEDGSTKPIKFLTSYMMPRYGNYENVGYDLVVKKPIMGWIHKGCHLKFSDREYVKKLDK